MYLMFYSQIDKASIKKCHQLLTLVFRHLYKIVMIYSKIMMFSIKNRGDPRARPNGSRPSLSNGVENLIKFLKKVMIYIKISDKY
ncbi:hypothetical protein BpHYR1_001963 [Brachionus plicatilis]|uniref:Uncharacterized protein n=1 Tax=Brachionus plicatilis TaxID=10195 RepID=A0A3M7RTM0_BRAPC|nr:hypothetical protein BpHYR1_001963 [Brachionus plicatilis]